MKTSQNNSTVPEQASRDSRAANEYCEDLAEARAAARGAQEMMEKLHAALVQERARTDEIPQLREVVARLESELDALRATRTFRYTRGLRALRASRLRSE